jgi:hypothetical protein
MERRMTPFRSSLPARIISLSVAFALVSGGLIAVLGLEPAEWIPFSLLFPITGCVVGALLAAGTREWSAMAMVVALPIALWPYTMVLMLVTNSYRQFGWLLLAAGIGMTALTAVSGVVRAPQRRTAPARQSLA